MDRANPVGLSVLLVVVNTDLLHFQQNVSLDSVSNFLPLTLTIECVDTLDPGNKWYQTF